MQRGMTQMSETGKNMKNKTPLFTRLMENNKAVFVVSLCIALICWLAVSMFQTTETEKTFTNVRVQLNLEGSMPYNNGLKLFGDDEHFVDVTVKGKSYIVNSSSFADKIALTVSLASVSSAGTYSLPVFGMLKDTASSDAEITYLSKTSISLYFDESIEKTFDLNIDIDDESEEYTLPEGFVRENPRLSTDSVTLQGPALEINRIASVNAVVKLDKEITGTEAFEAEIVPVGSGEGSVFPNVTRVDDEPVYITVPVSYVSEYTPVVTFTGMPNSYKTDGVKYTVSPSHVKASVSTADSELINVEELSIGTIDFSEINNDVNYIKLSTEQLPYTFVDGITDFTVTVDMTGMEKRWLEIPVSVDGVKLPEGAVLLNSTVQSVQVIGPADSVGPIDAGELIAIPLIDGIEFEKGINAVPVKITLRTLTDSWVRGEYTVNIEVK